MPDDREGAGALPRVLVIAAGEDRQRQLARAVEGAGSEATMMAAGISAALELPPQAAALVLIDRDQLERAPALRQQADQLGSLLHLIAVVDDPGAALFAAAEADDLSTLAPAELRARLSLGGRLLRLERQLAERIARDRREQHPRRPALPRAPRQLAGTGQLEIQPEEALERALDRVHALSSRHGMPYAVLLAGVDSFADYRERHDAAQAEEMQRIVAQTLCRGVRKGDEVFELAQARWLFLCLVQNDFGLMIMGERLKDEIARLGLEHEGTPTGRLTVSLGGATYNPRTRSAEASYPQLMARAEESLARAGAQGRGQLIIWSPTLRLP